MPLHPELAERLDRIARDEEHGGGWLAREAVEVVMRAIELGEDPEQAGRAAVATRPAMGAIAGAIGRVLAAGRTPEQMLEEAQAVLSARERAARAIAVLLEAKGTVMTHSRSATVRETLVHDRPERVLCTASEPIGEGRVFARDLASEGLATEVVEDGDAERAVREVDLLVVGADTVFLDGTVLNKVGTYGLTRAAKEAGVPVVVACEVIKLVPVELPEQPPLERGGRRLRDVTPPEQIDRFVTEEGPLVPGDVAALIDRTPFLRDGYALIT